MAIKNNLKINRVTPAGQCDGCAGKLVEIRDGSNRWQCVECLSIQRVIGR